MPSPYLFTSQSGGGTTASAVNEPTELTNLALATSVSGNALTIALKGKDGNDPSVTNEVLIAFRDSTITSGVYVQRSVTSALSLTVSSGSTLGMTNAVATYLYVYALDNGGTVELAVINGSVDEGSVQTTTAEGGAGGADSAATLYSTTARTSKSVRMIGRILITEATAGTWASNATELCVPPFRPPVASQAQQETASTLNAYVTPGVQQYHPSACKTWVDYTSITTTSILASYNVTSLSDNGTGNTTVTIATDFSSANYGAAVSAIDNGSATGCLAIKGSQAAGTLVVLTLTPNTLALADSNHVSALMFGDQ